MHAAIGLSKAGEKGGINKQKLWESYKIMKCNEKRREGCVYVTTVVWGARTPTTATCDGLYVCCAGYKCKQKQRGACECLVAILPCAVLKCVWSVNVSVNVWCGGKCRMD